MYVCRREGRSIWSCTLPMSTIQNHCSDDEANSWRNKSAVHRKIQFCNMTSGGRTATPPLRHTHKHMEHTRIHTLWVAHGVYLTPLRLSQHPTALTCQPTRRSGSQASQPASHCCWKSNCYSSNGHCCRQLLLLLLPLPRGSATLQFCWLSPRAAFGGNPAVACATNEMSGIYSQLI